MAIEAVDIYSPDWYLGDTVHDTFAELRRRGPVHWQDIPGQAGYWAVLRHADVVHVARHPELFSASEGGIMLEDAPPAQLERMRHMLLAMDPPIHTSYRKPLAPHFGSKVISTMEAQIRARCRVILDAAAEAREVEFVHAVAGPLPAQVIADIMGLPEEDIDRIQLWAELQTGNQDEELVSSYEGNAGADMAMYAIAFAGRRRSEPRRDDITSLLLETTYDDGRPMSDVDFGSFFVQLVTAGNDTTKTSIASGVHELIRHPDQQQLLREDPTRIPAAVEEILRFCNPLHYFRRTAVDRYRDRGSAGPRGRQGRDDVHIGEPRRDDVRRSPALRHRPIAEPAPELRHRRPLLPRRPSRPPRGQGLLRGAPRSIHEHRARRRANRIRSNLNTGLRRLPVRLSSN